MERIFERWYTSIELSQNGHYLPLVQRILNYTVDGSIGTQPGMVMFGDMVDCDLSEDYPLKLREAQSILVETMQDCLKKHQRYRSVNGEPKNLEVIKFAAGDYFLLTCLNHPPNKLAGMYRGPMIITSIDRPDLV